MHNRMPNGHPVSLSYVIDVLGLSFSHVIHGCLYKQALAEVRFTDVGIKYLYCIDIGLLLSLDGYITLWG